LEYCCVGGEEGMNKPIGPENQVVKEAPSTFAVILLATACCVTTIGVLMVVAKIAEVLQ
jgi:hypothetical protein